MLDIIPAILTDNPAELRDKIARCESVVDRVQVDIIDGVFADNKTILPESVAEVESELLFDYHLMVNEPGNWIEKTIRGYADRIIGQIEMMKSQRGFVNNVLSKGYKAGLAIDLDTGIDDLDTKILPEVDVVLVMSVPAGFGGQDFHPKSLQKIVDLDKLRKENEFEFRICDDGGVSLENIDDAHYIGADEVSIGSRLFDGDVNENVENFKNAAHNVKLLK